MPQGREQGPASPQAGLTPYQHRVMGKRQTFRVSHLSGRLVIPLWGSSQRLSVGTPGVAVPCRRRLCNWFTGSNWVGLDCVPGPLLPLISGAPTSCQAPGSVLVAVVPPSRCQGPTCSHLPSLLPCEHWQRPSKPPGPGQGSGRHCAALSPGVTAEPQVAGSSENQTHAEMACPARAPFHCGRTSAL